LAVKLRTTAAKARIILVLQDIAPTRKAGLTAIRQSCKVWRVQVAGLNLVSAAGSGNDTLKHRMAFTKFSGQSQGVQLLQRSLARGRLGHAYLFTGHQLEELETLARTLAKTLNCQNPIKTSGVATDCCDECPSCRKIDDDNHADLHWARAESKSRIISVDQTRELSREIQLKPTEAG
jgi:hypothetical protein